jgi:hypothetical protein
MISLAFAFALFLASPAGCEVIAHARTDHPNYLETAGHHHREEEHDHDELLP